MCGVQLKDRKWSKDLMLLLVMENCVSWYGHVLRRKDSHVLRRALNFEIEGQRKKVRSMRTW